MRTLFAGLVTATLFLGCELDTGEDPPAGGESGEGGSGGTASGRGGQSGNTTAGSSGSSAGSSTAGNGTGGNLGGAGKGAAGSDSAGGTDNAGGTTQAGTGGRAPNGGRGGMTSGGSGGVATSGGAGGKGSAGSGGTTAGTSPGGSGGGGDCTADIRCTLEALPSTGDRHQDCVDRINQFRVECACLPPLERWTEGEACADEMSEYDSVQDEAHAGFRDDICGGGSAQNECPGYRSETQVVELCLQQMWDEGPPPQDPCEGDCFQMYGHFINMTNERFTKVACGFFTTDGNEVWSVQNFSR